MIIRSAVFYILTWFFLVLLGGFQQATGIIPQELGLAQWGPGLAAIVVLLLYRKDAFKLNFIDKNIPITQYLLALTLPIVLVLLSWPIINLIGVKSTPVNMSLPLLVLWAPVGALGEEIGWRGWLHKYLDPKFSGLISSIIVGLLWMPIHIFAINNGLIYIIAFLVTIIAYSIVMYSLVKNHNFNILLATAFHLGINLGNILFIEQINEPAYMVIQAVLWTVAAILIFTGKKSPFTRNN